MKAKSKTRAPGVIRGAGGYYLGVKEVMSYLGCKETKAYGIIKALRIELEKEGKLTKEYPMGKIPKRYFFDRCMIEE